jgi:CPA2 family monovalent cation:H+ antiporter-2
MGLDERIVDDIVDRERDSFAAALDDARADARAVAREERDV